MIRWHRLFSACVDVNWKNSFVVWVPDRFEGRIDRATAETVFRHAQLRWSLVRAERRVQAMQFVDPLSRLVPLGVVRVGRTHLISVGEKSVGLDLVTLTESVENTRRIRLEEQKTRSRTTERTDQLTCLTSGRGEVGGKERWLLLLCRLNRQRRSSSVSSSTRRTFVEHCRNSHWKSVGHRDLFEHSLIESKRKNIFLINVKIDEPE